jgi:D-psicose/D-tagatose/L-ribulose 3-epimerase
MRPIYWSPHAGIARDWPPEKLFDVISKVGYAGTEIWMDPTWFDWHDQADTKRIKAEANKRGLETPTICWRHFPEYAPTDPATAEAGRAYLLDCLRVGEAVGADTVLLYPGVPQGVDYETAWVTAREVLGSLEAECRARGIRIAIEFESPGSVLLGSPEDTLSFIRETGTHIAACADTYHLFNRHRDQREGVSRLKGHLALVHLSDSKRQLPGKAGVDYPAFFQGLKDIGYDGRLFVQYDPVDDEELTLGLKRSQEWATVLDQ